MTDRLVAGKGLAGERAAHRIAGELADEHRGAAQRGERRLAHEAAAVRRLDDTHGVARGAGEADELERLVGGDPAAHAQQDA